MLRGKEDKNEEELEDTKIADAPTPETEERDEACKPCEEDPNAFSACITLTSELILSKSAQEITTVLDSELKAIREAAVKRIAEIKS